MIELLAISDDPALPAEPLRALHCGELTALYRPAETRQADADELWRHEHLIEALMEARDLLPVRFGTVLADEHAAACAVRERSHQLLANLGRVRGAVELAVRAEESAAAHAATVRGREYLRAKARRLRDARRVHEPLDALARESVTRPGPELLRAAYLVERAAVPAFVERVRSLQAEHAQLDLLCTGPWPPYSFADVGAGA